jgi:hypothetical protein
VASASVGALWLAAAVRVRGSFALLLKKRFGSPAGEVVIHQNLFVTPNTHDRKS